jgi:uncharacterized protein YggU (UPF0235/DUF167 family)
MAATIPPSLARVIERAGEDAVLRVRVIPRSGTTRLAGIRANALLIRLAAAPVAGEANAALVTFVARLLSIPRRCVTLAAGERSRDKRLRLTGLDAATVADRLGRLLPATAP